MSKTRTVKDFASLSQRFRPSRPRRAVADPPRGGDTASRFVYRAPSVRDTQKLLNYRVQGWMRRSGPRVAGYVLGGLLLAMGCSNAVGILSLRGSQYSMVNNLLLVFFGSFLLFLASHERAVERAGPGARGLER